jgi:hypothetical protein
MTLSREDMTKENILVSLDEVQERALAIAEQRFMRVRSELFSGYISEQLYFWKQQRNRGESPTLRCVERWVKNYDLKYNFGQNIARQESNLKVREHNYNLLIQE